MGSRSEAMMPSDPIAQDVAVSYLRALDDCLTVWVDVMGLLWSNARPTSEDVIAAIGPLHTARQSLAQRSVTPAMAQAHQAALGLLQSAMDTLDAIAAGRGKIAVQELQAQLTIFQTELVLFAKRAGLVQR
jgi:hypothetical protein